MKKKLPIGISDFRTLLETGEYYYVDKSLFIKEVLDSSSLITLITRPRRFGKTLNLSMLKYFLEAPLPNEGISFDSSQLFQNLKIWKEGKPYTDKQGKYPVIFLTFKDAKEDDWDSCYENLKGVIADEFKRHKYLLNSGNIDIYAKETYLEILTQKADPVTYKKSIKFLSECLYKHYNQKPFILIDEYDTPIHESYVEKYYTRVIKFIRSLFGISLKDNNCIEKAVITGILRVSRESLFSDLNNLDVSTIMNYDYADKFGILEPEVEEMLKEYGIERDIAEVKRWYNGYVIGKCKDIYNPWSIVNYVRKHEEGLKPYWVNTSSNLLVKELFTKGSLKFKLELEELIQGGHISKEIKPFTVMKDIEKDSDAVWSLLLFAGYLKVIAQKNVTEETICSDLKIPNLEVKIVYKSFVSSWLNETIDGLELDYMLKSMLEGNADPFGKILQNYVMNAFSYFDVSGNNSEMVYHAFVLGLIATLQGKYSIKSNRESGFGRYDIMIIPLDKAKKGIIIEFKKVDEDANETLDSAIQAALKQIEEKQYEAELRSLGITDIVKYGIAFQGKKVKLLLG